MPRLDITLDIIVDVFIKSIKDTAMKQRIELMEGAISNAKSSFLRNCISCGVPSERTAKEAGKRFVLMLVRHSENS